MRSYIGKIVKESIDGFFLSLLASVANKGHKTSRQTGRTVVGFRCLADPPGDQHAPDLAFRYIAEYLYRWPKRYLPTSHHPTQVHQVSCLACASTLNLIPSLHDRSVKANEGHPQARRTDRTIFSVGELQMLVYSRK